MENIELIFKNLQVEYLEPLLFQELKINRNSIIRSHFYDDFLQKNLEFKDIINLKEHFSHPGTGNIFLNGIDIGIRIGSVMVVISFDEVFGDVVLNFPTGNLENTDKTVNSEMFYKLIQQSMRICKNLNFEKIIIGYEPAEDEDMVICIVNKRGILWSQNYNLTKDLLPEFEKQS